MREKIAYVQNLRIPSELAHSIFVVKSCKALARSGHETHLILPSRKQPPHFPYKDIWSYYNIKKNLFKVKRISVFEFPDLKSALLEKLVLHIRFPIITWSFTVQALLYLLKMKPAIVVTSDMEIIFLLRLVRAVYHPKIIHEVHREPNITYEKIMDILIRPRVDLFVVISKFLKKRYLSNGIPKQMIITAPMGVDLNGYKIRESSDELRRKFDIPQNKKVIGYVGRFDTFGIEKGIITVIDVVAQLKKVGLAVAFCAVGGPRKYVKRYREKAKVLGLDRDEAIFIKQVKPAGVPYYLKTFDVCAMLYPKTHHFAYVMSPMKAIEYMASKKPIVASDLPSLREIFSQEEVFFVPPEDARSAIHVFKQALHNKNLIKKKVNAAYRKAKTLTWIERERRILRKVSSLQ